MWRVALVGTLALLPWSWYVLRDALGVVTDVVAIVLPGLALAVACIAGLVGLRRRPALALAASALLLGVVTTVGPWLPADTGQVETARSVTIAAANIGAGELEGEGDLLALSADVLVVSEIGPPLTQRLEQAYPYHIAEFDGPAIAVFSRSPFTVLETPSIHLPGMRLRVQGPTDPFELVALHVPRPWWTSSGRSYQATVAEHHRLIALVAARVAHEQLPVVVAGDLNTTDRGRAYRTLTDRGGLNDAMLDGWAAPTQIGRWSALFVRIDHLLLSTGWCADDARQYPIPASDHRGVIARVGPCAG